MEKKAIIITGLVAGFVINNSFGQSVLIGTLGTSAHASAILELDVSGMTEKKGILLPRMTEGQKMEITSPASSLMIYQTDETEGFYYYDGSQWKGLGDDLGTHKASQNLEMSGSWISSDGDNEGLMVSSNGNIGIGVVAPAANLHTAGSVEMDVLEGSGTRMVVADSEGQLSTQAIPASGPGAGSTLNLHLTGDAYNIDVSGVSFIYVTTTGSHEIFGLTGGVQNQIIHLVNPEEDDDVKFKKEEGTQEFIKDFDLKKEEGGIIMYTGSKWIAISKH